ncbi:unnamed protein product [Closterium sp. NIES-53]
MILPQVSTTPSFFHSPLSPPLSSPPLSPPLSSPPLSPPLSSPSLSPPLSPPLALPLSSPRSPSLLLFPLLSPFLSSFHSLSTVAPITLSVQRGAQPHHVVDYRGPNFHEPSEDPFSVVRQQGRVVTQEQMEAIMAREQEEEEAFLQELEETGEDAVDIGEEEEEEEDEEEEEEEEEDEEEEDEECVSSSLTTSRCASSHTSHASPYLLLPPQISEDEDSDEGQQAQATSHGHAVREGRGRRPAEILEEDEQTGMQWVAVPTRMEGTPGRLAYEEDSEGMSEEEDESGDAAAGAGGAPRGSI